MSDTTLRQFDTPTPSDVHIDGPLGAAKGAAKKKGRFAKRLTFLARFRDLVVGSGKLSADDYSAFYKQARGHAGGIARADARLAASESPAGRERRFADAMAAHTGVMVGLWLDPLAAQALAIPGGEAPEDLHVTLAMVGDVEEFDDLAIARMTIALDALAARTPPVTGVVGGYGRFYGDDADEDDSDPDEGQDATDPDVFYASPDAPGLDDLEEDVEDALAACGCGYDGDDEDEHGFQPHISLIYLAKDAPDPATKPQPIPLTFTAITFCVGDRRTVFPLRGMVYDAMPMAAYGEVVVGGSDHGPHLFADVSLAEVPTVIPILPKPGNYAHPVYGSFDVTPALIDTIIANFDSRVRPQDVPINAEHVAKTAGAMGYVRKVVRRPDGGLDGIPEFTDLGAELIRRDRFKYCSAEIDTYTDPLTTDDTPNVLFGVALTTRPFFKEASMPRMAASDDAAVDDSARQFATEGDLPDSCFSYVPDGPKSARKLRLCSLDTGKPDAGIVGAAAAALGPGYRGQKVDLPAGAVGPAKDKVRAAWRKVNPDKQDDAMPAGIKATEGTMADEDITQKFAELTTRAEAAEATARTFADVNTKLTERVATMETKDREQRFTAEVRGRSDANGNAWPGETAKHVAMLDKLALTFGEGSDEFKQYVEVNRTHAAQLKASGLFTEIGSDAPGGDGGSAEAEADRRAKALVASDPSKTYQQHYAEVVKDPDLNRRLYAETKGR